jgi:hypothetical protein
MFLINPLLPLFPFSASSHPQELLRLVPDAVGPDESSRLDSILQRLAEALTRLDEVARRAEETHVQDRHVLRELNAQYVWGESLAQVRHEWDFFLKHSISEFWLLLLFFFFVFF